MPAGFVAAGPGSCVAIRPPLPIADAGRDCVAYAGPNPKPLTACPFVLDGSTSSSPIGIRSYVWKCGSYVVGTGPVLRSSTLPSPTAYVYTLTVTDAAGQSVTDSVNVNIVSETNKAPTLTVPGPQWTVVGGTINFTATANDPFGDPFFFSASAGSINPTTGAFSWTPTTPGSGTVVVRVTDLYGASDAKPVPVTVSALIVENVRLTRSGTNVTVTFNLRMPGTITGANVKITGATLGGVAAKAPLPSLMSTIPAGASVPVTLSFANVAAGSTTLVVNGTSANGLIYASLPVRVP